MLLAEYNCVSQSGILVKIQEYAEERVFKNLQGVSTKLRGRKFLRTEFGEHVNYISNEIFEVMSTGEVVKVVDVRKCI